MSEKKKFPLRTVLTVTTGRLLTERKGEHDNGIGDLYEILGHMTNDSPFTHTLGRFAEECKPHLLEWFPELKAVNACLGNLDKWIACDRTGTAQEGIKMWLAELKLMFPEIKKEYEIGQIPEKDHGVKNPIEELQSMMKPEQELIVLQTP